MTYAIQKAPEWRNVDAAMFRNEIVPRNEPAVLKGLIRNWPAVQKGLSSAAALGEYLKGFDRGRPVDTLIGDAAIMGRFFYRDDMGGMNFERKPERIGASIERLLAHIDEKSPPAIFIQAATLPDCLPEFSRDNAIDLLNPSVTPRIWIGNAVTVSTHFDFNENIACVVGGRRRFTFFPPEQLQNLYAGPFEFTPAGIPVSMVNLEEPDFVRYPRFEQALATARQAELEPGDAVYIPYFWWHHVKSLHRFNVLVNYWWNDANPALGSPLHCLIHGMLALRDLPPVQRRVWRAVFDHYVFETNGDPAAHLPPEHRGVLGELTPEYRKRVKALLLHALNQP